MRSSLRWTVLVVATVVPGFCQLAAEHAAALAGGGIGLVAGKPMSKAIDHVLTEVEKAPKAAPAPKAKDPEAAKNTPAAAPVKVTGPGYAGGGDPAPSASSATSTAPSSRPAAHTRAKQLARRTTEAARPADEVEETTSHVEAIAVVPDVSRVQEGMGRTQVLAMLGDPSYHVTIPDEGHLHEVFGFTAGNRWLGTVRLDNGEVVKVETPR